MQRIIQSSDWCRLLFTVRLALLERPSSAAVALCPFVEPPTTRHHIDPRLPSQRRPTRQHVDVRRPTRSGACAACRRRRRHREASTGCSSSISN